MRKPTPSRAKSKLESACTLSMRFLREKHSLDHSRVRFWRSDRKVPATYFPLLENNLAKTPRKTASRLHRVESTFHSKKSKEWKVQTAQKTRPNSLLGHACLESGYLHLSRASSAPVVQVFHQSNQPRDYPTDGSANPRIGCKTHGSPASSVGLRCHPWVPCLVDCPNARPRRAQSSSPKRTPTNQTASEKGLLSTTSGDIQQKNRHTIFSGVETSMKMSFHSFEQNRSQTRERRGPLSNTPLLFFH